MKLQICANCRKEFPSNDPNALYCSKRCEKEAQKSKYTTISIKHSVKNRLILLQNDVLIKSNSKIPYSDLIDNLLDIAEKNHSNLTDYIINEYKYYL